jgi:Domain of unknown function (DUF4382)
MRCLPRFIRNTILTAVVVWACVVLASCGTTCVAGIFANGTGIIIVKNSTPPPACPFSTGMSTMNVTMIKSRICETCTTSSRAQHIFVTIQSVQLHSVFADSPNNPEWLELAPQLVREPRQIDLVGDSTTTILVQSAVIPAGTYPELRLRFVPDPSDVILTENSCGPKRKNCMFMADGRRQELHFTGNDDDPELLLPLQYNGSTALAVVPGETVGLRLTLQPKQVSSVSPSEGWQIQYVLVGSASVSR